jgi:2-enoate reductase
MVGCETALYLAKQNKRVTIIEMMDSIAADINERMRYVVLEELEKAGIDVITGVKVESFLDFGVQLSRNNHKRLIEADSIVIAIGSLSNKELFEEV